MNGVSAKTLASCCRLLSAALASCANVLEDEAAALPVNGRGLHTADSRLRENPFALAVARKAANECAVTVADMLGDSKRRSVSRARRVFCAVLLQNGKSPGEVGRFLGRSSSTPRVANKKLSAIPEERAAAERILREVREETKPRGIGSWV